MSEVNNPELAYIGNEHPKAVKREAMEIYRPKPAMSEEREKHRQRAHFGEHRLATNGENGGRKSDSSRRGGFGRSRGRGLRDFGNRRERHHHQQQQQQPQQQQQQWRDTKPEYNEDDFDTKPLPQTSNWADEEYEEIPSPSVSQTSAPEPVHDLREKLRAMRMEKGGEDQAEIGHQRQEHNNYGRRGHKPGNVAGNLPRPKRNTENFEPSHAPPEMRILCARPGLQRYDRPYSTRDVLIVNDLFGEPDDLTIYYNLLKELEDSGVSPHQLWQLWHGDSHLIADDKRHWKKECPTFSMIVDKITEYFDMDVKATRLNWYRDSSEWKPFHHDAAAMKPDKARTQNFTVAVSFGLERDAAFEHATTKTIISMPQPNGTVYTFGRDVNILWRHGITQLKPEQHSNQGRISVIAWGWIPQVEL